MKQPTQGKETQSMSEAVSEYREYVDVIRPPAIPRGHVKEMDLITATTGIRIWSMKTKHPLEVVLSQNFFSEMIGHRFRRDDRIELIADCDGPRSVHALLVVDDADKHGTVSAVSLLHRYERRQ
jgi:hypothetical protein